MKLVLSAALALVPAPVFAFMSAPVVAQPSDPDANPEAYWGRGWNCGQAAENYNVTIAVDDPAAAFSLVDAAIVAAGGRNQGGFGEAYFRSGGDDDRRPRQAQYLLPLKAGEKAAKKIWDFGELTSYSVNRQDPADSLKGIDERIGLLDKELKEPGIDRMPAARYFLKSRLTGLRQAKEGCLKGAGLSAIIVAIQPKPQPKKR